ncbi:protein of unknown function [Nitrospina watsonii]|uniref:Uncharacterized protein n=1 Tax=Nitrospina watsonii TaxID=1323948 RepID=A0ABN8W1H7_9BACT|nr:protein of unknown function [Nitrospina watsonii]
MPALPGATNPATFVTALGFVNLFFLNNLYRFPEAMTMARWRYSQPGTNLLFPLRYRLHYSTL